MSEISAAIPFASGAPVVALGNVGKTFANGVVALDRLSLDVWPGEFVSLLGPSGCGKSTALRIIAGLSEPSSGTVDWLQPEAAGPRRLGFVFQEPTLMPWATVAANVGLPLKLKGERETAAARVAAALARVGLEAFADSYPRELSGGMKMRVSIARALVTEPRLLLMDEPFAALDEITRFRLNDDLLVLWRALGKTVVFVTHSVFESVYLSQRIVVMTPRPGRVFTELAIDAPYPRDETLPHLGRICRPVPPGVGGAGGRDAGRRRLSMTSRARAATPRRERADRALRVLLPIAVLALSIALWEAVVDYYAIPPYVLPGPRLVLRTLVADWARAVGFARWSRWSRRSRASLLAVVGGVGLAVAVQPVPPARVFALSLCGHPAGDADRGDRAAAAHLSAPAGGGADLRLDRRVLPGAGQHHARPQLGRPQPRRPVRALRRQPLAGAVRPQAAGGTALTSSAA